MRIKTTRFGEIEVSEDCVLTLADGMLGFSGMRRYVLIPHKDGPFRWFQALDEPGLAFLLIDPWLVRPDYEPVVSRPDAMALGLAADSLKAVYVVVTIPPGNPQGMTANLLGPIVINADTQAARQVVVLNEDYGAEYPILEGLRALTQARVEEPDSPTQEEVAAKQAA